jgi:hypothetical protein
MKKILSIIISFVFILGLTNTAFASDYNKTNDDQITLQSIDALNPEIVKEKLNGIRLTPEDPIKTIVFDDGSKAVVEVTDLGSEDSRYIKAISYKIKIGVVFEVTYKIGADWQVVEGTFDRVTLNDHWDDAVADSNVSVDRYPTIAGSTSGHYIKVWGSILSSLEEPAPLWRLDHFEFIGYSDGSCQMYPIDSYPGCP